MLSYFIKRFLGNKSIHKIRINDLLNKPVLQSDSDVVVKGWIRSVRKHKRVVFLDVNDGSTMHCLQVVLTPTNFKSGISYGASVCCTGKIITTKQHVDGIEMDCNHVELVGPCTEDYVFHKHANHVPQYLRQYPHLRLKEDAMVAVLRTRNVLEMEIHKYFQERQFLHVHTPTLTSSDCEGAGEVFSVSTNVVCDEVIEDHEEVGNDPCPDPADDLAAQTTHGESSDPKTFFGTPVYLTVSGQLQLEACATGIGDVYTLGPAFRAEKSTSNKHLSEFRMLEVEMSFTQSLDATMDVMEDSIRSFIRSVYEKCDLEIQCFYNKNESHFNIVQNAANAPFIRLPYREALEVLSGYSDRIKTFVPTWGDDFNNEHEALLMEHTGNCPVFITDFSKQSKPFYMYENSDGETVSAVDLIFPFCGELCGGSVREHRIDSLQERLEKLGMLRRYEWYLDLRRYGNTPHAGYGMGFDRLVRFIVGHRDIRDVVPFPRTPRSCVL